jgi:hypothetical protein
MCSPSASPSTAAAAGEPSFGDAREPEEGDHPQDKTIFHVSLSNSG